MSSNTIYRRLIESTVNLRYFLRYGIFYGILKAPLKNTVKMPLNNRRIRNAKPSVKPYKLTDGGGLYLHVITVEIG
ncbi:integrase [Neisseria shayeganii 871]|uniref:Integrase n=1 Tax=Neisseria shayeganii 871 TaxID=1032488 RepID=G4CKF9_9NEIS|nr:integrase [Neisseria shayeganii 871]